MSAPASAWETAVRAMSSSVGSFLTRPSSTHAAVAVARVLAEAHVGDHEEIGMVSFTARTACWMMPSSA